MDTITRRTALKLGAAGAALMASTRMGMAQAPADGGVLRLAMTTSDIPTTGGMPDNGSEGGRSTGYPIYDGLVLWDFTKTDAPAELTPGLATEWHIDPDNNKRWLFTIRQGVLFHDGSPLSVDDIVWNLDRQLNKDAPHYDKGSPAYSGAYARTIASYEKVSDTVLAIDTKAPFSMLPYQLSRVFIVSPRQYESVGSNWQAFAANPSGTGPFKVTKVTPKVALELARNEQYWDTTRVPKVSAMVLRPIPDANTRVAALRSGQVDWIEFPDPDSIPSLKAAGVDVVTKPYLHLWSFVLNCIEPGPLTDVRVRQALNYAIDRDGMVGLLNGTAVPAIGLYDESYKLFGNPTQRYNYDPDKATAMLAEAGIGASNPITLNVMIPTAGSGNMIPVAMGQFVQQCLADINVKVEFDVADWGTVITAMRTAPGAAGTPHRDVICHGQPFGDPTQFFSNDATFEQGGTSNWGRYSNPKVDVALKAAYAAFTPDEQDAKLAEAHALVVDDAPNIFVVHDLNPRALSPKVKGFVQAQSWYQDFTQLTVEA